MEKIMAGPQTTKNLGRSPGAAAESRRVSPKCRATSSSSKKKFLVVKEGGEEKKRAFSRFFPFFFSLPFPFLFVGRGADLNDCNYKNSYVIPTWAESFFFFFFFFFFFKNLKIEARMAEIKEEPEYQALKTKKSRLHHRR